MVHGVLMLISRYSYKYDHKLTINLILLLKSPGNKQILLPTLEYIKAKTRGIEGTAFQKHQACVACIKVFLFKSHNKIKW